MEASEEIFFFNRGSKNILLEFSSYNLITLAYYHSDIGSAWVIQIVMDIQRVINIPPVRILY